VRSSDDSLAFAESVAGVVDRIAPPELTAALDEIGWLTLAHDPELVAFAGLAAVELGRRLAPLHHIDRLLGGSPMAGDLVRSLLPGGVMLMLEDGAVVRRPALRSERLLSPDGLEMHRVLELGQAAPVRTGAWQTATRAWIAASVGYLAGLGQGALDLTIDYVSQRRAFGTTLAALAPVQQLLADVATAVRGVVLLADSLPDRDGLAYAGPAVADACVACHQVTGAIGFTLEYPLHHFTQRARAAATWNDALLEWMLAPL
jgi:alkylation response protein AidB-like acyl-CoA dehydrogenase